MIRLFFAFALLVTALQPPDESNVPENEKRIPAGHYCKREGVTITAREKNAHSCSCQFSCTVGEDGTIATHEAPNCLSYCHVNGRRCTCWPEGDPDHPCVKGQALMDMDGRVVAVARSRR